MFSRLVLHADDFGMNWAVTDGILRGFRQGLLTSTSLMANALDAVRALSQWKELEANRAGDRLPSSSVRQKLGDPDCPFDLGVHLNLTQGRPLGERYPVELLDAEGRFPSVFSLFARLQRSGNKFRDAIRDEWQRQIQLLCDHGLHPTHLNGHQYVEMLPIGVGIVPELVERFDIKTIRVAREPAIFRNTALHRFQIAKWPLAQVKHLFATRFQAAMDLRGIAHPDAFFGTAHAGSVDLPLLRRFLVSSGADIPVCQKCNNLSGRQKCLPHHDEKCDLVEVALHPGEAIEKTPPDELAAGWHDSLAAARPKELEMLVSDELPRCLESLGWRLGRLQLAIRVASSRLP